MEKIDIRINKKIPVYRDLFIYSPSLQQLKNAANL